MGNRFEVNKTCVVGFPQCDYVFSSNRTCFIAYDFEANHLELDIVKNHLISVGVTPIEAGDSCNPGKLVFCQKICSQIIMAKFCIVFLNPRIVEGKPVISPNVFFEYGAMVGFSKRIIPFIEKGRSIPFDVSPLDTVVYEQKTFSSLAKRVVSDISEATCGKSVDIIETNPNIELFLSVIGLIPTPLINDGEKNLDSFGAPFGYRLYQNYSGMDTIYVGNFIQDSPVKLLWRVMTLVELLRQRILSLEKRVVLGIATVAQANIFHDALSCASICLLVGSSEVKRGLADELSKHSITQRIAIYDSGEVEEKIKFLEYGVD